MDEDDRRGRHDGQQGKGTHAEMDVHLHFR
jgi:hypothetical protein